MRLPVAMAYAASIAEAVAKAQQDAAANVCEIYCNSKNKTCELDGKRLHRICILEISYSDHEGRDQLRMNSETSPS